MVKILEVVKLKKRRQLGFNFFLKDEGLKCIFFELKITRDFIVFLVANILKQLKKC